MVSHFIPQGEKRFALFPVRATHAVSYSKLQKLKNSKLIWLQSFLSFDTKMASLDYAEEMMLPFCDGDKIICLIPNSLKIKNFFIRFFDKTLINIFILFRLFLRKSRRGLVLSSSGGIGDTILFSTIINEFSNLASDNEDIYLIFQKNSECVSFLFEDKIKLIPIDYSKFRGNVFYRTKWAWRIFSLNSRIFVATDHLRHPFADECFAKFSCSEVKYALEPKWWEKYAGDLEKSKNIYDVLVPSSDEVTHRYIRWYGLVCALRGGDVNFPQVNGFFSSRFQFNKAEQRKYVVLHPFASTRLRQPSVDVFISLLNSIPETFDIILSCGPEDLNKNKDFIEISEGKRISKDDRRMEDKAHLLMGAALVITVDTSILHLASVLGVNTLCIASAAHVVDSVPYPQQMCIKNTHFILADVACAGCLGQCDQLGDGKRYPCIDLIDTASVIMEARKLLDTDFI